MKNNYRKTLNSELYKLGFGFDFCKQLTDTMCEIGEDEKLDWIQDVFKDRLKLIKKAIQATLIEEGIKNQPKQPA